MDPPAPDQSVSDTTDNVDLSPSSPQSLHRAVYARRAEYTRSHRIRVKVGTWNVAACPGTDKDIASWFVDGRGLDAKLAALDVEHDPVVETQNSETSVYQDPNSVRLLGGDKIGLYVLGLQEVVNLNPVSQYVYSDPNPTDKWRLALEAALPEGYGFVTSEQMSGLLLLIYASPEVAPTLGSVTTKVVGTGVGGWFGNKGAAVARIVFGETTRMVFVNSHLSSGSDASTLERRCWDVRTIMDRARFEPVARPGDDREEAQEKIGDEDFVFWFGDLNFRLDDIPGDDIRRLLTLHTRGEYDLNKSGSEKVDTEDVIFVARNSDSSDEQTDATSAKTRSTDQTSDDESVSLPDPDDFEDPHGDPASLQATLDSLLPHDQLQRCMKQRKIFHDGWREGTITFLPSYKYDVGTVGLFDTSEKKRAPSWCDRILYRTKEARGQHETRLRDEEQARKRDEEMKARGIDHAGDDDEVLFDYDPESDGDDTTSPGIQPSPLYEGYEEYDEGGDDTPAGNDGDKADRIKLEIYTSHQRITSSDHKPVVAIFTVDYDAVVPDLKAEILGEVARELDRAENEGRPSITIVSEGPQSDDDSIDYGEVKYLEKYTTYLTVANTGRVPATISFLERPGPTDDPSGLSQWLKTFLSSPEPSEDSGEMVDLGKEVTLEPGETVNAVIQAFVSTPSQARLLNDGRASLEDVLVLRVANGRDHFLPVRAVWLSTCIGRSVDELIRVPDGGIREFGKSLLSGDKKDKKPSGAISYDLPVHRSAPKELFKLIEALELLVDRALADEQILESYTIPKDKPAWPFEDFVAGPHEELVSAVIDVLDTDRAIADAFPPEVDSCRRLETVADVLLLFLRSLKDGMISEPLWTKIEQAPIRALSQAAASGAAADAQSDDDRGAILDVLSTAPNHNISFVFLTTTIAKVVGELTPLRKAGTETATASPTSPTSTSSGAPPQASSGGAASGAIAAIGALGRRSISLRRSLTIGSSSSSQAALVEALAALERRKAKEKKVAQVFGGAVCRAPTPGKDKEKRALEAKQAAVVELFLRRRDFGGP